MTVTVTDNDTATIGGSSARTDTRRRLRLGLAWNFPIFEHDVKSLRRLYDEIVDTIVHAEELGIDSVWLAQHHFDAQPGGLPSPLILLGLAAKRTSRIALGTGITILPLEDPIRLAEDAAVVDLLSQGRLHLGLATGGPNGNAFSAYGLDPADRRAIFNEKLVRLHEALSGAPLAPGPDGPRLAPPGDDLKTRLWQGVSTPEGAAAAARDGDGIQLGVFTDPADTGQRPKIDAYLREWQRLGRVEDPRVALFRFLYLGESKEEVFARFEPVLGAQLEKIQSVLSRHGELKVEPGRIDIRSYSARDFLDKIAFYGNPDEIAADFQGDPTDPVGTVTEFVANFNNWAPFDAGLLHTYLETLAHQIGPQLGWHPGHQSSAPDPDLITTPRA